MFSSSSEQYLSFALRINPGSPGWYESLINIPKIIKGATYTVNVEQRMALVSGRANSRSILKKLSNSGSEVAWIKTGKPNTYGSYETDHPYLQYHYQYLQYPNYYHYSKNYCDPYVPYPPHFEPYYSCFSTRYYYSCSSLDK